MKALKYLVALAMASLLAACGGGSDPMPLSPTRMSAAPQAQASGNVTADAAAEMLLNLGETTYPTLFPHGPATQSFPPFRFRYYPSTGLYLGVIVNANAAYTLYGVYTAGGGFGTLQNPMFHGTVNSFIPGITIDAGGSTGHTLTVQVTVMGIQSPVITLQNVPTPNTEQTFCSELSAGTVFQQIAAQGGGTLTINSCSFNGTVGNISATMTINYPGLPAQTIPYTIVYTYS